MEDGRIIELYWQRDELAIAYSKESYGKRLKRLAFGILKNHEDAEESENDTYLRAWNTMPPQRPQYLYGFLAKICRNLSLDKFDWLNAQRRNAEIVELTAELEQCIPNISAEYHYEKEEIGSLLDSFLMTLTKENRMVFLRRYMMADSVKDIATSYGISESKVKSSLFRTRKKLKIFLEGEGINL